MPSPTGRLLGIILCNQGRLPENSIMLTTQIENREGIHLVHVLGALDSLVFEQFKEMMDPLINHAHVRIVLDCEKLTYVNSTGLALLGRYQRISSQNLAFLGIAGLNKRLVKTIDVLGLGKLVKLYPTVEEALKAAAP